MNSLEGIIAANRHAERQQELNRATNGKADKSPLATAIRVNKRREIPKRDASGRLAR